MLRRVFDVDALACPNCLTPLTVLAFITDPKVLAKILDHLGLSTSPPPIAPPRLPIEVDLPLDDELLDEADYGGEQTVPYRTRFPP